MPQAGRISITASEEMIKEETYMEKSEARPKKVILAVDDMAINLRTLKLALDKYFEVRVANSGERALAIVTSGNIDLILLDIEMPEMSGFDFMQELKKRPDIKIPPVIFVTGLATPELLAQAKVAGAVGYVLKPFVPKILLKKINEALGPGDTSAP